MAPSIYLRLMLKSNTINKIKKHRFALQTKKTKNVGLNVVKRVNLFH